MASPFSGLIHWPLLYFNKNGLVGKPLFGGAPDVVDDGGDGNNDEIIPDDGVAGVIDDDGCPDVLGVPAVLEGLAALLDFSTK